MKKSDVKHIIQWAAKQEFTLYPESYTSNDGCTSHSSVENISQWALNAWECRSDDEIKRDKRLGLHPDNYILWALEAYEDIYHPKQTVLSRLKFPDNKSKTA